MHQKETNMPTLKATRAELRELEVMLKDQRDEAFEQMKPEDVDAMTEAIDTIKETWRSAVENAEEAACYEACLELETVVEKYGFDCVKSYVEDFGNGREEFAAEINLDTELEGLGDKLDE
jgi:hypothetical protein